jgi:pimeloyl-ACP methyl ester carboxylesterase
VTPESFEAERGEFQGAPADTGTLPVPENRRNVDSRLISIPVVRVHATGEKRTEPLFVLFGGPGLSNIKGQRLWPWFYEHNDCVMIGYRGIDGSVNLNCPEIAEAMKGDEPLSDEGLARIGAAIAAGFDRLASEGIDLDGYNVAEVAEDVEAARKALGYGKINLYGGSYGAMVAYVYCLKYPQSVGRVLLSGSSSPDTMGLWEPAAIDGMLERYGELLNESGQGAAMSTDLRATMRKVLATLPREWNGARIDRDKVRVMTHLNLHNVETARRVFEAYVAAEGGDYGGLAFLSAGYDGAVGWLNWGDFLLKGASFNPAPARFYANLPDPDDSVMGSPLAELAWGSLNRADRPVKPVDERYRGPHKCDTPMLLLHGTLDFSSPPECTKRFLPYLPNGHFVLKGELGHVEVMTTQPEAFRHLFERWFFEGVVDDSKYEYAPVEKEGR